MRSQEKDSVLVTGGAGYIGSHICKALANAGYSPITYDNLSNGFSSAVKWGPLVVGELEDRARLRLAIRDFGVSAVIHLAAHASVGESVGNPRKYFSNNLSNTIGLLGCMLDESVNIFVFSSTCAVYGNPETLPIDEAHVLRPVNPYGESKLAGEKILSWYERPYNLRWMALRYFNAAGADPDGELGECHKEETHLIPLALRAVIDPAFRLSVFGTDYPTPDGTAIRDFVHVTDLAEAHVSALSYLASGGSSLSLNLGTGSGSS